MKRKRLRRISVLLIPDDNAEPYNFRLGWPLAKLLMGVGIVLVLHVLLGFVSYWKYFQLRADNSELERSNTRLLDDNKRVYQLAAQLEEMSKEQSKILSLLGVDPHSKGTGGGLSMMLPSSSQPMMATTAEVQPSSEVSNQTAKEVAPVGGFLSRRRGEDAKYPLNMPTLLPVEGFLTTEFSRNALFPFRTHPGIDIAAKRGSIVVAAGSGQVVFANWTYDLGNLIIIHHGGTLFSYYGHNEQILARDKAFVKKGEPIALLGTSGKSSGPHLHFEIWKDGVAVDPRQFLLALRTSSQ
ncbi:MAG: M23 family metallopeptidase [candidate division KSB1 bacterium]|nr:M23 family metallopeptidase [candidate division KSB1 bacterium]MDZ7302642.1 M23 family metallopeptidase [candidate division KSB1 bacterium]MDZ7311519.1 M23 family metallopeptidase [candidate division KSB1 bacterium]